ncbi:hypothetical protein [Bythopirellula goksoeyrii]|uniref:Uncharacterized protein n=1 Tax=Bythopirellula goksoeyrii TaxID=1400387 RepID=A0A5B9QC85_9BACT|nr:hypothetical protein [Bythopirellula goksoeyrii]QEG35195.1 hypothetical protein Pr1d_24890 [Bythopirellula goksoeyrii]
MEETETSHSSKSLWGWVIGIVLLIAAFAASWVLTAEYTTEQTVERSFVIDEDFTKVRKIMVRTNATKEIMTMGGTSEFVEQKWDEGTVDTGSEHIGEALLKTVLSADPNWKLQLNGILKVRTLDDYIGRQVVTLHQDVEITPNEIDSVSKLEKGSERLKGYELTTILKREEDHTRVDLTLMQKIKTNAPWFAHGIADRRVKASAAKALEKQEQATIQLIDDNKDKSWLFPLN